MPRMSIFELPFFSGFFLPLASALSSPSADGFVFFFLSPLSAFRILDDFGPSSVFGASSRSPGSSTTKRYLHLGQSTFFPTRLESLMGTIASQLGHCCLKWVCEAIGRSLCGKEPPVV